MASTPKELSVFHLLPMKEDDLEEACRQEIWGNPVSDAQRVLLDRERTPEGLQRLLGKRRRIFQTDRNATFLKVVDSNSGDMVAWAVWHFCPALSAEEMAKGVVVPEWPLPQWYRPYVEMRRETLKGRAHYWLGMIVTAPDHRRRGAASYLVQWGLDAADEAGVEIWLESSVAGKPMYEKFGLRPLKTIDFDLSQLGYEGVDTHICMMRGVKGQQPEALELAS